MVVTDLVALDGGAVNLGTIPLVPTGLRAAGASGKSTGQALDLELELQRLKPPWVAEGRLWW